MQPKLVVSGYTVRVYLQYLIKPAEIVDKSNTKLKIVAFKKKSPADYGKIVTDMQEAGIPMIREPFEAGDPETLPYEKISYFDVQGKISISLKTLLTRDAVKKIRGGVPKTPPLPNSVSYSGK